MFLSLCFKKALLVLVLCIFSFELSFQMNHHLARECSNAFVECPFKYSGCSAKVCQWIDDVIKKHNHGDETPSKKFCGDSRLVRCMHVLIRLKAGPP